MRLGMNMDNDVDHAKIDFQAATSRVCSPDSTNSEPQILESKSSDRLSVVNSLSTYTDINRYIEPDTSFEVEDTKTEPINTVSYTEKCRKIRIGELQRNNFVSAKRVFLNWWLDTLGYNKPLRSAWEDEENDTIGFNTYSQTQSLTNIDGQWLSCCSSSESAACMFVSKYDDANTQNSFSNVSGPINFLAKTNKKLKVRLESLLPHLNSVSPDMSVYKKINLNQQFIATDANSGDKKYSISTNNLSSDNGHILEETLSWQTTTSCTRHMHDQNASSNVVTGHISSHISCCDSQMNKIDTTGGAQVHNLLDIVPTPCVKWTSTINKQNSYLLPSQQNLERYPSNDDVHNNILSVIPHNNRCEKTIFTFNEDQDIQPTSTSQYMHNFKNNTISYSKDFQHSFKEPLCDMALNNKNVIEETTEQYIQKYDLPCIRSLTDGNSNGHLIPSLSETACVKPRKFSTAQNMNEGCFSSNNSFQSKHMPPNIDPQDRKCMAANLENGNLSFSSEITKTKLQNNDSCFNQCSSVHDENINMRSYFSRLAEKKLGTKRCLKNSLQDSSQYDQHSWGDHAKVDPAIKVSSSIPSCTQLKKELQSSTALATDSCSAEFKNDHVVTYTQSFSDDAGNTVSQCKYPVSQYLPQISKAPTYGTEERSSLKSLSAFKCAVTCMSNKKYCSDQVLPECTVKHEYCKDQNNDLIVNNSLEKEIKAKECKVPQLSKYRSIVNDSEYNTSYVRSSNQQSMPKNGQHTDDHNSNYFEWLSASWSNTSLPSYNSSESSKCHMNVQARHTESTTDAKNHKQKEILQRARLLILMLNELPMSDLTKSESFFLENNESDLHLRYKIESGNCKWTRSHIISVVQKENTNNTGELSKKIKKESKKHATTKSLCDKISNSKNMSTLPLCSHHIPEPLKMSVFSNQELDITGTNKSTSDEALDSSRMSEQSSSMQSCMRTVNQLNEVKHHLHPKRKSVYESQHAFYNISPTIFSENTSSSFGSSENEMSAERVLISPISVSERASNSRGNSDERNKSASQKGLKNSESVVNEGHFKSVTKKVSNRISKEQSSQRQLEIKLSEAAIDNKAENLSVLTTHGSETNSVSNILVCQNQRPSPPGALVTANENTSQTKITLISLPILNRKVPVFPKPRPHALGQIQDGDSSVSSKISDSSPSTKSELIVGSFKRQLSTCKQSWTKTNVPKNVKASEMYSTSTAVSAMNQKIKYNESVPQKSNKEISNTKTQMKALPPLQNINSQNITSETSEESTSLQNVKTSNSSTLNKQHKNVESQHSCGTKECENSLMPLDVISKSQCRPKCNSPESSRKVCRKTPLTSLNNNGMLQIPLRRKFDRLKYKVSDAFLKVTPNSKSKCLFEPPSLCRSITTDNAEVIQSNRHNHEVSVNKCYASDPLQFPQNRGNRSGENVLSCSFELPCSGQINNTLKKSFLSEREIKMTKVRSQQEISEVGSSGIFIEKVQSDYECDPIYSGQIKYSKIGLENKEISKHAQPTSVKSSNKTSVNLQKYKYSQNADSKMTLENQLQFLETKSTISEKSTKSETKNSKKTHKMSKSHAKKAQCPCTSSFKFLMLLLSDDLEADVL